MKLNDAVWGALLLLFGVVVLVHVQAFPKIPGQNVGPALFPGLVAAGLCVCALLLIGKGLATRRQARQQPTWTGFAPWFGFAPWTRSAHHVAAFALVIGVNVFYILVVDRLGFLPVAVVYLATLFWIFGVARAWILPVAVLMALGIHYAFYKLLKVPLPWGLLQGIAW